MSIFTGSAVAIVTPFKKDGSVDYESMDLFESVKKDALIAEYRSATTGTFGYDITGHVLTPQRGK